MIDRYHRPRRSGTYLTRLMKSSSKKYLLWDTFEEYYYYRWGGAEALRPPYRALTFSLAGLGLDDQAVRFFRG